MTGPGAPGGAAPPPGVDSHAHLAMDLFAGDLPEVLARARAAGIGAILTCSTSLEDAPRNAALARASEAPRLLAAVGFHPHQAKLFREGDEARMEEMVDRRHVVAIGETGLDYHYDLSPRETQREVFARQVRLAARLDLPIVVHCRNAAADVAAILDGEGGGSRGGILHCFTEDAAFARRCLEIGFHVSFSGIVTFRKSAALREVARGVPEDRLLVETDAPYLAPEPHRGERNEPARAMVVLRALAELRGVDPGRLAAAVTANFRNLLRIDR